MKKTMKIVTQVLLVISMFVLAIAITGCHFNITFKNGIEANIILDEDGNVEVYSVDNDLLYEILNSGKEFREYSDEKTFMGKLSEKEGNFQLQKADENKDKYDYVIIDKEDSDNILVYIKDLAPDTTVPETDNETGPETRPGTEVSPETTVPETEPGSEATTTPEITEPETEAETTAPEETEAEPVV